MIKKWLQRIRIGKCHKPADRIKIGGLPFKRLLDSNFGSILYHYCSNETFLSIIENKTIRLSDANMLNDHQEGRWGYTRFEEAASNLIKENVAGIDLNFCDKVDDVISHMQLYLHPTLCSFSKRPDVLSQWRGYADDGIGLSIGFDAKSMQKMAMTFLEVQYDVEKQISEIENSLIAIRGIEIGRKNDSDSEFRNACALLAANLYAYKNPAFSEEEEIRGLHLLKVDNNNGSPLLSIDDQIDKDKIHENLDVKFRCRNGSIIAYADIPLPQDSTVIKEIWLGPKNRNGPGNIMYPLHKKGFKGTRIEQSDASYR